MLIDQFNKVKSFTIGGKANGLFYLQSLGLRVPEFVVLPAECITIKSEQDASEFNLEKDTYTQLLNTLNTWEFQKNGVVVRSSVADEDGETNAFAGIMKTFLNLRNIDDVVSSIRSCIASAFSEQALQYRKVHHLTDQIKVGIIVQKQIDSAISGILFTTNPKYPQELAIHSVYGQGEGIVSGELEPDEFYFFKQSKSLYRKKIAEKCIQYKLSTKGIVKIDIESLDRNSDTIQEKELYELFETGIKIEESRKSPQDIEFCISNNQIYFLQSRAITQKIEDLVVYDNSNIQESYAGVISPLTFSFAKRAYATVYTQTMRALQLPQLLIDEHKDTVENLLGMYQGRIYYNINNWYKGLKLLPSFKQNKTDMERMMGLKDPVDFIQNREKSGLEKIKLLPQLMLNVIKLGYAFLKLQKSIDTFLSDFLNYHTEFYYRFNTNKPTTLKYLWDEKIALDTNLLNKWSVPIINDFYVMIQNGKVHRMLSKKGVENVELYLSKFKFGNEGIASYKQGIALEKVANIIKNESVLVDKILNVDTDIHEYIKQNFPIIYNQIEKFVNDYGDRTIAELKLETITMRVDRAIFYKYVKVYLQNDNSYFDNNEDSPSKAPAVVNKLLIGIKNREELRLKRTHLFGMYRTIYLSIAEKLLIDGKLNDHSDIFYLYEAEIEQIINNPDSIIISDIISERKTKWENYKTIEVPDRVIFPIPPGFDTLQRAIQKNQLAGEPCAGELVVGEAIVVENANDDLDVRGKIIIAKRTDPGWIALFPSALGVIIERGSSLSHSVLLLREMNKPSIINVPELLQQIKTGDKLELNPQTGIITILKHG